MAEPIRIVNGLFLGTFNHLQNTAFTTINQISLAVCVPYTPLMMELPNAALVGMNWFQQDQYKFSEHLLTSQIISLIHVLKNVKDHCQNALICDENMSSSALGLCCLVLMVDFRWNLLKTLQYLTHKIPNLDIQPKIAERLLIYDKNFNKNINTSESLLWDENGEISDSAILARNTFINSKPLMVNSTPLQTPKHKRKNSKLRKVYFSEQNVQPGSNKQATTQTNFARSSLIINTVQIFEDEPMKPTVKPTVKPRLNLARRRAKSQSSEPGSRTHDKLRCYLNREQYNADKPKMKNIQVIERIDNKIKEKFELKGITNTFRHRNLRINTNSKLISVRENIKQGLITNKLKLETLLKYQ